MRSWCKLLSAHMQWDQCSFGLFRRVVVFTICRVVRVSARPWELRSSWFLVDPGIGLPGFQLSLNDNRQPNKSSYKPRTTRKRAPDPAIAPRPLNPINSKFPTFYPGTLPREAIAISLDCAGPCEYPNHIFLVRY